MQDIGAQRKSALFWRTSHEPRAANHENGSALILAVVLTSLLAIIGTVFIMTARVDRASTSALLENKELNLAVDAIITQISKELTLDVPGVVLGQEYHDYPGATDRWLSVLEPEVDDSGTPLDLTDDIYYWRRITDLYETAPGSGIRILQWLGNGSWQDYYGDKVEPRDLRARIISPADPVRGATGGTSTVDFGGPADADGDGVADSRWIVLPDTHSSKGKPIFAAIRIIDNGGMININTAYRDPTYVGGLWDGSRLSHINLEGIRASGDSAVPVTALQQERYGAVLMPPINDYQNDVQYDEHVAQRLLDPYVFITGESYNPFDIGDELELRNRFFLSTTYIPPGVVTRCGLAWPVTFNPQAHPGKGAPVGSNPSDTIANWFDKVKPDIDEPGWILPNPVIGWYNRRFLSTAYSFDRIINPLGGKMANISKDDAALLYEMMQRGLEDGGALDPNSLAAQIAVNIIDFRDGADYDSTDIVNYDPNDEVTAIFVDGQYYYGFERPCTYISELAHNFVVKVVNDQPTIYRSYAIELHKPYFEDDDPVNWQLLIGEITAPIAWSGSRRFHVMLWEEPNAPLPVSFYDPNDPGATDASDIYGYDWNDYISPNADITDIGISEAIFSAGSLIELQRSVPGGGYITVDSVRVPDWLVNVAGLHSRQRDITRHKCIMRLWASVDTIPTLGRPNNYIDPNIIDMIQAHPIDRPFRNVGEVGMIFSRNVYDDTIIRGAIESDVRLNLANPYLQRIFNYLTVFDPSIDGIDNDGDGFPDGFDIVNPELKISGRININTAPWYVIAQLPWTSYDQFNPGTPDYRLAQAIVAYRDKLDLTTIIGPGAPSYADPIAPPYIGRQNGMDSATAVREEFGFSSIGELLNVTQELSLPTATDPYYDIRTYGRDWSPLDVMPDVTPDTADDDFEERDVIFSRVSNLVTVRSDVFTAYILVRIGTDGPQKRVIAIFDRSNVYPGGLGGVIGDVKLVALHPVPDPR